MNHRNRPVRRALVAALLLGLPVAALAQTAPPLKTATWWNTSESGWGLFTIDQGNVIAPGWFTYGPDGKPTWYLVPGARPQADGSYTGNVCRFTGVPFAQIAGNAADPCQVIGTASLRFTGNYALRFDYTIDGVTQSKSLTRFPFGQRDIVCRATSNPSRVTATNYSDLWWGAPETEGWGVHMSHVDNQLFATWYTYDTDRKAIFYIGSTQRQEDGSFSGPLNRQNNGTPATQIDGTPPSSGAIAIGTVTLRFTDGETATFTYTVGSTTQTKTLRRYQFGNTPAVCENAAFGGLDDPGTNPGGGGAGADECFPPLAVGDKYRLRDTPGEGDIGFTDVEVVGTGVDPFQGRPVFRIKYTPVDNPSADIIEFVEQTPTERIYYGSEGFIPEANARGTTRFDPPVRVPRVTPVGAGETLTYRAISNYTAQGQAVTANVDFIETYERVGTEDQTVPAGSFSGACKFDTNLKSVTTVATAGVSTRVDTDTDVIQWAHPLIGPLRTQSQGTSTVTVSGAPFPIPPTVTPSSNLSEIISATVGGRSYP